MDGNVVVKEAEGEMRRMGQEVYVLMMGYPGEIKDLFGSDLAFPYIYGATLGVFSSMDELKKFFATMLSIASDIVMGVPVEQSAEKHGLLAEEAKRFFTISGSLRIIDSSYGYFVLKYSNGEYSVIDFSDLLKSDGLLPQVFASS